MTNAAMANTMINSAPGSNRAIRSGAARKPSSRILALPLFEACQACGQASLDPEIVAPFAPHVVVGDRIFTFGTSEYLLAGFDRLLCAGHRIGAEACPQ